MNRWFQPEKGTLKDISMLSPARFTMLAWGEQRRWSGSQLFQCFQPNRATVGNPLGSLPP